MAINSGKQGDWAEEQVRRYELPTDFEQREDGSWLARKAAIPGLIGVGSTQKDAFMDLCHKIDLQFRIKTPYDHLIDAALDKMDAAREQRRMRDGE